MSGRFNGEIYSNNRAACAKLQRREAAWLLGGVKAHLNLRRGAGEHPGERLGSRVAGGVRRERRGALSQTNKIQLHPGGAGISPL